MTVLFTADLHLSANPRDGYRWKWLKALPALLKKQKAEALFVLGDLTEEKGDHGAELVNPLVDGFYACAQVCWICFLEGNHDGFSAGSPFFAFLRRLEGVSWVGRPTPLSVLQDAPTSVQKAFGKGAVLLPFTPNPERDWKGIDFRQFDWVLAHQTFAGADSESGHKLGGVSLNWFPRGVQIISGDIHRPQTLGPLTYVGSPYRIDFGETHQPRILSMGGGKLTSISTKGPQKCLVEMANLGNLSGQKMRRLKVLPNDVEAGDIIKIKVSISPADYADWPKIAAEARTWGEERGCTVELVQPHIVGTGVAAKPRELPKSKDDPAVVKEYGKTMGLDTRVLNTGLRLLERE